MRISFLKILVVLFLLAFNSCNLNARRKHQITIGVSYQNFSNEFLIKLQDAIRTEAKKLNINLIELDAQGRADVQISHIENFVARNVDAIIINPVDEYGSAPAVDIAVRENKPIVVVNTIVYNLKKASAYVGSPDVEAGKMEVSEIMRRLKGHGNIALLQGVYGQSAEVQRTEGIRIELAKFPGARIVAEQSGNWDRAKAMSVMENWLSAGRKIDAVIAENDEMAMGASEAIYGKKKRKKILIIGIDGIRDALKAVAEGKLVGTVFQDPNAQGKLAVKLAYQLLKGKKVKHNNYIPFQLITKANVNDFLK